MGHYIIDMAAGLLPASLLRHNKPQFSLLPERSPVKHWLQQLSHSATPDIDECVQQLGATIPWLNDLKKTSQDPTWHAEGNVQIHTGMVLAELYKLLATEAVAIQGQQRQALILSAILHDVGKTRCTRKMVIRDQQRQGSPVR